MIKFEDFFPQMTDRTLRRFSQASETFDLVVDSVNNWIEENSVKVINIETIVLPHEMKDNAIDSKKCSFGIGVAGIAWVQGVRVWYEDS